MACLQIRNKCGIVCMTWGMAKIKLYSGSRVLFGWPYASAYLQVAIKDISRTSLSVEGFSCSFLFVPKHDLNR
eukprot:2528293-Ditylum_brightwellii.AAC.1